MKSDIIFIENAVERFNRQCFDGVLPPIPVVLTKARTFLGKVTYRKTRGFFGRVSKPADFTLRISSLYNLSEREWEDVVIHELIHYYIAYAGIRDSSAHGTQFRRIMERINADFGRNVTVRHHISDGELPPKAVPARGNCVCISQLSDGRWGITVCSETMMSRLRRQLPKCFDLKSMTWLRSSDPFFSKYPRSRTPKIYRITEEELSLLSPLQEAVQPNAVPSR